MERRVLWKHRGDMEALLTSNRGEKNAWKSHYRTVPRLTDSTYCNVLLGLSFELLIYRISWVLYMYNNLIPQNKSYFQMLAYLQDMKNPFCPHCDKA